MRFILRSTVWLVILSSTYFLNCSRDYPLSEKPNGRFPLSVGNEWWFRRELKIEFYNGHPPWCENPWIRRYSIRWKIANFDFVQGHKSYVLINYRKLNAVYHFLSVDWYTDYWEGLDGLYHIAYANGGDGLPPKLPKGYKLVFAGKEFSSFEEIFAWAFGQHRSSGKIPEERIVRIPPRRVLEYPLEIGKRWIAFDDVWLQTRRVVGQEYVTTEAGTFSCYKIEVVGEVWKDWMVWYDWFSDEGLVKRYIWTTGEWTDAHGNVGGKFESTDIYLLKNYFIKK